MPSVTTMVRAYKAQQIHNTTLTRCKETAARAESLQGLLIDLRARDRVTERADAERAQRGFKKRNPVPLR